MAKTSKKTAAKKPAAKKKSTNKKTAPAQTAGQPLFFKDPVQVLQDRHADAGIKNEENYSFARDTNTIPINMAEFAEASKYYPIAFSAGDKPVPLAIVGVEQDKNAFVNKKGEWKEGYYIPAYVRRYPFGFSGDGERLTLCVDESADAFVKKAKKSDLKFFENGKQTNLIQSALAFCSEYHKDVLTTQDISEKIAKKGLLKERTLTIDLEGMKKPISLSGFQTIDDEAFRDLNQKVLQEWHKSGVLSLLYLHILSASNWTKLADNLGKKS